MDKLLLLDIENSSSLSNEQLQRRQTAIHTYALYQDTESRALDAATRALLAKASMSREKFNSMQ